MTTEIDSLVVTLNLDASKFTEEQRKALGSFSRAQEAYRSGLKQTQFGAKAVAEEFHGVTTAAEVFFGALAGGEMAKFAKDTMDGARSTGQLATNIGIGTDELSAFGQAVKANGGNADAAGQSLKGYADQIQRLKSTGQVSEGLLRGWSAVGGGMSDNPIDIFKKLAHYADHHTPQETNLVGAQLGLDPGTINLAVKGYAEAMRRIGEAQKSALSPEQQGRLEKAAGAWDSLGQSARAVGTDMVSHVAPAMEHVANAAKDLVDHNRTLADSFGWIAVALTALKALQLPAWLLKLFGKEVGPKAARMAAIGALPGRLVKGGGVLGGALEAAVAMKTDSETGNSLRTALRKMFGIEDPGEAAPWAGAKSNEEYKRDHPDGGSGGQPMGGSSVRDAGMAYFQKQGWTRTQAAAIMAQAQGESGFDPNASNNIGGGHRGLFQWGPSRRASILTGTGVDVWKATAQQQFEAAQWELDHTERKAAEGLRKIPSDAGTAAVWMNNSFERNGDPFEKQLQRAGMADHIARIGDLTQPTPNVSSATNSSSSKSEVNIGSVVVNTPSHDPRAHGAAVAGAIEDHWGNRDADEIARQANSGLTP